jgi:hypothetical protein
LGSPFCSGRARRQGYGESGATSGLIRAGVVEVDVLVIQIDWALPRCLGNNRITLAVNIGVNIGVRAIAVMARPKL